MAHRPVGAGISLSTTATAVASTSFTVQSDVIRVAAVTAGAFVAIGTNPTATTTDYYVPAGTTATLAMTKASNRIVGITTGSTTTIDFAEGTQCPFGVGDFVTLSTGSAAQSYHNITHAAVQSVDTSSGINGYHQTRCVLNYNSSGIVTAFSPILSPDAVLRMSLRLSARTEGGSGTLYLQQVQISGQA
jgi:hypothetical protein